MHALEKVTERSCSISLVVCMCERLCLHGVSNYVIRTHARLGLSKLVSRTLHVLDFCIAGISESLTAQKSSPFSVQMLIRQIE